MRIHYSIVTKRFKLDFQVHRFKLLYCDVVAIIKLVFIFSVSGQFLYTTALLPRCGYLFAVSNQRRLARNLREGALTVVWGGAPSAQKFCVFFFLEKVTQF